MRTSVCRWLALAWGGEALELSRTFGECESYIHYAHPLDPWGLSIDERDGTQYYPFPSDLLFAGILGGGQEYVFDIFSKKGNSSKVKTCSIINHDQRTIAQSCNWLRRMPRRLMHTEYCILFTLFWYLLSTLRVAMMLVVSLSGKRLTWHAGWRTSGKSKWLICLRHVYFMYTNGLHF